MGAITFKCPNCGGELIFEPTLQKYVCEYCDSKFTQQELDALTPAQGQTYQEETPSGSGDAEQAAAQQSGTAEQAEAQQSGSGTAGEQAVVYSCPSCGAQIMTDETTAATFCYYCHNPVVLEGRLSGEYLPDQVIPFKIGKKEATEKFLSFVKKKKYIPSAFFDDGQIDKLTGVYYPFWIYDCELDGGFEAEATRVREWRSGDIAYTETSRFRIDRDGTIRLDEMMRNALRTSDRDLVAHVMPFNLQELQPFSMGYLSGFQAEKRDMEKAEFEDQLRTESEGYARNLLERTCEFPSVRIVNSHFEKVREGWKYCLLPVWVLTYRGRNGEMFYYALNGQNGEVAGKLPLDQRKLMLHSGLLGLLVCILFLIGGFLI